MKQDMVRHAALMFALLASAAAGAEAPPSCVPVDAISGAVVTGDRSVELHLNDGSVWQMGFQEACPSLGYYQGFYYRRERAGLLCAGHDAVIPRSGGDCPISTLKRTAKPARR